MAAPNFADKTVWTGDNLDILRGMNSETVDLIYLDPPFNSNRNYEAPVGSKAAGAAFKDTWTLSDLDVAWMGLIADEQPAIANLLHTASLTHGEGDAVLPDHDGGAATGNAKGVEGYDTWTLSDLDVAWMGLIADEQPAIANLLHTASLTHGKGMQSYLTMMAVRLLEMRRVLKDTGSIYLHCDPTASHYLKLLMDATFGQVNFRNEIVWSYRRWPSKSSYFQTMHDVLLFYVRGTDTTFNVSYEPPSASYIKRFKGKTQVLDPVTKTRKIVVDQPTKGLPQRDVWDISIIAGFAKERVGYPTQKPLALLDRIIKASTNEGDVVLDPFCGCATACVAADRLSRKWVGIDISPKAAELVNMKLQQAMGSLFHHGYVTARTDIPRRTDIDAPIPYRQNKHILFGQQEGLCNGCRVMFPFRNFTVDHMVPQSRGGTDHLDNLQLLCGACNSVKGDRPQEHLIARLKEMAI